MDWSQLLSFQLNEDKLLAIFETQRHPFMVVCLNLGSQGTISYTQSKDIREKYDIPKMKKDSILELIEILKSMCPEKIRDAFEEVLNPAIEQVLDNMYDVNYSWKRLIKLTKIERQKDTSIISLLPFLNSKKVKLDEIVTSIKVYQLKNKDILEMKLVNENIDYFTFYKLFGRKFNKLLVQGEPGMGKTVHAQYLINKLG